LESLQFALYGVDSKGHLNAGNLGRFREKVTKIVTS